MVVQRYTTSVPAVLLVRAMEELGPGARTTLLACKRANEKRNLTAGEFLT